MVKTYIIAEAGVNHNGQCDLALQLVEQAAAANANAIKFQTYQTDLLVVPQAPKAEYQKNRDLEATQANMLKKFELSEEDYTKIIAHCKKHHIDFLSTPFDIPSLNFLIHDLQLETIKIGSGDLTNSHLLLNVAQQKKSIILSTGMANLGDIEQALGVLAFGFSAPKNSKPCLAAFMSAYYSETGQQFLQQKVTLLHCVTDYPANFDHIHLRAIDTLQQAFHLPVGYSDHSLDIFVPIAAVARGACMIEKHLTLDKSLPGPDHQASLTPAEFSRMVTGIRQVELALGQPRKIPNVTEMTNRVIARRSLVAQTAIKKGDTFTSENLASKRPAEGRSSIEYWDMLGQIAERDYVKDELI